MGKTITHLDDPTVTHQVESALVVIEDRVGVDVANFLRNHIESLRGRLRAYEMGDDRPSQVDDYDDWPGWAGAAK